jgi:hypothetical protein
MPVITGFIFGLVLLFTASLAAGFGHGLYFPLGLVAAPFSIAGIKTAFFAAPFLWGAIGHSFRTDSPRLRILAISLVIAQYSTAAILLSGKGQFADYEYWPRMPAFIHVWSILTIGLFLLGQMSFWWGITAHSKRS